ncbi:M48 family metallopeptidase [Lysobacter sp. A421]
MIDYRLLRRQRKTLEIAVEPDATVVVAAPPGTEIDAIEARLRKRAGWIMRQQRYFSQFLPRTTERRFMAGETHLYLGRQYRLKVVPETGERVKLVRGFIMVPARQPHRHEFIRESVEDWYRDRARIKFAERVEINLGRFPDPEAFRPRELTIRLLRKRWGSMSPAGNLLLNRRLILAPVDAIDYVITHELCHVAEPHHGSAFHALLDRVLPDWKHRKARLERVMA